MIDIVRKRTTQAWHNQKKRAKQQALFITYTADDLRAILKKQSGTCYYCMRILKDHDFQFDHAAPLKRGGSFTIENTVATCSDCNKIKGIMTPAEFLQFINFLNALPDEPRVNLIAKIKHGSRLYA